MFILALAAVVWGSLAPQVPSLDVSQVDKLQHFVGYGVLAAFAFLTCRGRSWRAALALVALGVGVEFAQAAGGLGRHGSPLDAMANAAGVLLVAVVWPRR